jgi:hypothetical protein
MNDADREMWIPLMQLLRIFQERELHLQARLGALRVYVCGQAESYEEAEKWLDDAEIQWKQSAKDIEAQKQLDDLLDAASELLKHGKKLENPDA